MHDAVEIDDLRLVLGFKSEFLSVFMSMSGSEWATFLMPGQASAKWNEYLQDLSNR